MRRRPTSSAAAPTVVWIATALIAAAATTAAAVGGASAAVGGDVYTRTWAVRLERGLSAHAAERVAAEEGFNNAGKIMELDDGDVYLFEHPRVSKRSTEPHVDSHERLVRRSEVLWAEQQVVKRRVKRDLHFNDPLWHETWYLDRGARGGFDMNVKAAWSRGVTGRGVVVTVLDDGLEWQHPDLHANYDPEASIDINNSSGGGPDRDPTPRYDWTNENRHGTRCAGEIAAAANNGICSVGVAYNSRIGGVRMLDGDVTDSVEAQSLSLNPQHIDIYSASWGPDDNGRTVDGPGPLARAAFLNGITKGRGGKGSLFVWASGNGGSHGDSCACDGYTNNPFTLSVSSATQSNARPWYLEECASTLATTYSSGNNNGPDRQVVTTDLHHACTEQHTGTSASAPLAAGIVALALEANPRLTWRDMQYIVLMTANPHPLGDGRWITNGVGRRVSHLYGYGLMDAGAMVDLAKNWSVLPERKTWQSTKVAEHVTIGSGIRRSISVPLCQSGNASCVRYLEHVQLVVAVESSRRGSLRIVLHSPAGTASTVLPPRHADDGSGSFNDWPFTSVHFWGEQPAGEWIAEVFNDGLPGASGTLQSYQLVLSGTSEDPLAQCHPECRRPCTGPANNQCRECVNYRLGEGGPCVAQCPARSGYYTDVAHRVCSRCLVTDCLVCDATRPMTCDVCAPGLLLDASHEHCVQGCPVGTWTDTNSSQCTSCGQAHCLACTNGSRCDACATGYDWVAVASACAAICTPGTYREVGLTARCLPCDSSCVTCTGSQSSQCSSCTASLYLHDGACVPTCPAGTYADDGRQCRPCAASCGACNGPSNNNCLACVNDSTSVLTLYNECLPLEICTSKQFRHANGTCLPCDGTCLTCSGSAAVDCTGCTSDGGHRYLSGGSRCVEACDAGEYVSNGTCLACIHPCARCTAAAPGHCEACADGWLLQDGACTSRCAPGSYVVASPRAECLKCHPSCGLCHGPGSADCSACADGLALEAGTCVTNCSARTYPTHRSTGGSGGGSDAAGGSGGRSQPECLPCHRSCASCSGPGSDECTSCDGPLLMLKRGRCVERPTCHADQFYDGELQECMSCHKSCLTCTGHSDRQCTACSPLYWHDVTDGSCQACCGPHGSPLPAPTNWTKCCPCSVVAYANSSSSSILSADPDCAPLTTAAVVTTASTPAPQQTAASSLQPAAAGDDEVEATGTTAAAGSLTRRPPGVHDDGRVSSTAVPDDGGTDVLQLEHEMGLLSTLAAVVGAITLGSCAAYGAALVVLQARQRGACGARCSSRGVVYVQVDTNADGDVAVPALASSMAVHVDDDYDEEDECEADDERQPCRSRSSSSRDGSDGTLAEHHGLLPHSSSSSGVSSGAARSSYHESTVATPHKGAAAVVGGAVDGPAAAQLTTALAPTVHRGSRAVSECED